jgi:ABC-type antimicrobial peptide transport system ATPase subunit
VIRRNTTDASHLAGVDLVQHAAQQRRQLLGSDLLTGQQRSPPDQLGEAWRVSGQMLAVTPSWRR